MKFIGLIISIFILLGCGSSDTVSSKDVEMVLSEVYTVYPGNKVQQETPNTLVRIIHIDGKNESSIILLEGNATIIRKP